MDVAIYVVALNEDSNCNCLPASKLTLVRNFLATISLEVMHVASSLAVVVVDSLDKWVAVVVEWHFVDQVVEQV